MGSANVRDLIDQACALKQLMNDHILFVDEKGKRGLYTMLDDPEAFKTAQEKFDKVLTRQYAPAIGKIVAATTHDDLVERRDKLDKRLNKGWAYCHLHPADEEAYEAWEALLVEYTVIQDALDHIGLISGTLGRIDWIESFVRPMEQGVLV